MDNKLYGQSPDIFTGDKQKAKEFIYPVGPLLESQLQRGDDEDTLHLSYVIPHILQRTPDR